MMSTSKIPMVSVIVPTKNSSATLRACLESIRRQSYENIELIVVDNNSTDQTKEIASTYTDYVFNHGPERCAQRNFGAWQSRGSFLLFIDSDMELSDSVVEACVDLVTRKQEIKAVVIPEESFGVGFWSRCKWLERTYYTSVEWMQAARFFRKSIFEEMDGFNESLIGGDDFDLSQRIESKYGSTCIARIQELIRHNEQRIKLWDNCKKKYYYAQTLIDYKFEEANRKKFLNQASIVRRFMLFFSNPAKLLESPLVGLGMLFMKVCEFGFGGLGYLVAIIKRKEKRSRQI